MKDHIIVCGYGHVGQRIVCLLQQLGESTFVIALQQPVDFHVKPGSLELEVGDACEDLLLKKAGIENARAIIVVTNSDLANVSIALDSRRMNPKIRIVARLFDQNLAVHLEKTMQIDRALSASALAAPGFIAAVSGKTTAGIFDVNHVTGSFGEELIEGPCQETVGEWEKRNNRAVAVVVRDGKVMPEPGRDMTLRRGNRLTVLAMTHEKQMTSFVARDNFWKRGMADMHAFVVGWKEWWRDAPIPLRTPLIALFGVILFSVVLFHFTLKLTYVDALYFVTTIITTVGFGDHNFHDAGPGLKLYGSFLMLCGAAILATLFSIMADIIVGTRLKDVMARGCADYKGHIIVAGLGNIGFRLVKELKRQGETVVAVERGNKGEFVGSAQELAPVVAGDARMAETLRRAGLSGAKAMVAVTDDDLANLSIGLAVRRIHPTCRVVLRVFDSNLAEKMKNCIDIDEVLSVSGAAAPTFVGAALDGETRIGMQMPGILLLVRRHVVQSNGIEPGDSVLWIKRAGSEEYVLWEGTGSLKIGDEWVGISWRPLKPGGAHVA